jgi:hypothetical protein
MVVKLNSNDNQDFQQESLAIFTELANGNRLDNLVNAKILTLKDNSSKPIQSL